MDFKVTSRFVVFWICCAPLMFFAQHDETIPRLYSMKDGLPDEGINAVIRDSSGFIWLGTYSGLCKFDGYLFTNYRNNPASSNSLRNNLATPCWKTKRDDCGLATLMELICSIQELRNFIFIGLIGDSGQLHFLICMTAGLRHLKR